MTIRWLPTTVVAGTAVPPLTTTAANTGRASLPMPLLLLPSRVRTFCCCYCVFNGEADLSARSPGTSVGYWAPLWPYPVSSLLTLDDDKPVVVDLLDHANTNNSSGPSPSQQSQIRQEWSGLKNVEHKLVVSKARGGRFVVVDAFRCGVRQNLSDVDRTPYPLGMQLISYTAYVKRKGPLKTEDKIALGLGLGLGIPTFIAALWQMARWYLGRDYPTSVQREALTPMAGMGDLSESSVTVLAPNGRA